MFLFWRLREVPRRARLRAEVEEDVETVVCESDIEDDFLLKDPGVL